MPDSQKLRTWQDFLMTFDCTIQHTAGKDNHMADTVSRIQKYSGISTTEDKLIPDSVDSITIRPSQEISSNYINLSNYSTISSPTSNWPYTKMLRSGAINVTHVDFDFNRSRGRAETDRYQNSCPYVGEEDMELNSKDDYEVIKKEDKVVHSDEKPLSAIPEELARSTKPLLPISI